MAEANIRAVITADDRASRVLAGFGDGARKTARRVGIAIAAVGAATVAFGVSSVKSYAESENALAQLNATLKSTKGVAGVSAKSAVGLANSLQRVTKFSDETVLGGENLLLTFTKIGKDIFPEATEVMLDMSTALGQDVKSSAIQLGKALQDPILGITALRRVGVNFNDEQKEVIKKLVETGQSAKAQALILKELQVEFGGSARAAGETFAGKLAILKNTFDEVKESIGQVIVTALTPLAAKLSAFVASDQFQAWLRNLTRWLQTNLPIAINYVTTVLIPSLINIFNAVWPVVKTVLSWIGKLIKFLGDNTYLVYAFVAAFVAVKASFAISRAAAGAIAAMDAVGLSATRNAGRVGKLRGALILLSKPWVITLGIVGVAAVIGALRQVQAALQRTKDKINDLNATKVNVGGHSVGGGSDIGLTAKLRAALGGKALGGPVSGGTPYIVGERGPELFTPNSSGHITPNNQLNKATGSKQIINLNVHIGMYAGSQMEKRKVAKALFDAYDDLMRSNLIRARS